MDEIRDLHQRDALRKITGAINALLGATTVTPQDVDKIFVMSPDRTTGQLMTRDRFNALDLAEIGGWVEVSEFDINT